MKKTLKIGLMVAASAFITSQPAHALFTNGGFETGDFSSWDIATGQVGSSTAYGDINWSAADHGIYAVIDNTATMPGQTTDVDPYNGTHMARINDINGYNHATRLSQSDTISQQDIDDGATIFVNWGAMLIEPVNVHPAGAQPNFGINLTVNGTDIASFTANALAHNSDSTWSSAGADSSGSSLWYKHDTWSFDLSTFSVGDTVSISMWVADCSWGGHGGYAFLDGIGTTNPDNPVPEPATMLLFGTGLAGFAGSRLCRKKKA